MTKDMVFEVLVIVETSFGEGGLLLLDDDDGEAVALPCRCVCYGSCGGSCESSADDGEISEGSLREIDR